MVDQRKDGTICPFCFFKEELQTDPDAALMSAMAFGETCGTASEGKRPFGIYLAALACEKHGVTYIADAMNRAVKLQQPLEDKLTEMGVPTDIKAVKAAIQAAMKSKKTDERPN